MAHPIVRGPRRRWPHWLPLAAVALVPLIGLTWGIGTIAGQVVARPPQAPAPSCPAEPAADLRKQTAAEAAAKSAGCVHCHLNTHDPHGKQTLNLGCIDCHGGNPNSTDKVSAHVHPCFPEAWPTSGNPERSYTLLNREAPDFIRFVNPGDLRVAHLSCGTMGCHVQEVLQNRKSMMTHGCMLWGAALYNNGSVPMKAARYGESYSMHSSPQYILNVPAPTEEETRQHAVLPFLAPLARFENSQPSNILRIFEPGGRFRPDLGNPERREAPGRPILTRLSTRGLGTDARVDGVVLGLEKDRRHDPTLNFLGTNDFPGDYRSSGCTACHVVYANDRSPYNSGPYARFGNRGRSFSADPTIPKNESGHPIDHKFTTAIPTSQCIVCHMHPGTNVLNTYTGFMWWDEETDGELIYPTKQRFPTAEEELQTILRNTNESAVRNNLADPEFVANLADLNPQARLTQFADFHGHGWAYRAVFRKDRHGTYLDRQGNPLPQPSTAQLMAALDPACKHQDGIPVHQLDIHLDKGMHCVDCHFVQEVHGDTKLYGEVRAAMEIQCIDCHGTIQERATLRTSGPAHTGDGRNLELLRTPFGKRRFERRGDTIVQNSMVEEGKSWEVVQVKDSIDPANPHYNRKSHLAKTVRLDAAGNFEWGDGPETGACRAAHENKNMNCIACHSGWNPSCYGCHLSQKANWRTPTLHWEGDVTRADVAYNFQTLRDDVFMLARDGNATGNRIGPARSSCAIYVSAYNLNREVIYTQQQTISAEGLSGIAFSTNAPHTVRGRGETKNCTDCHLSQHDDNNAIMCQLLMLGTNYVNFIGRHCWVAAGDKGMYSVVVTELNEPQAVIGSSLHRLAFPDYFRKHVQHHGILQEAHNHSGQDVSERVLHPLQRPEVRQVQALGEYVLAACGCGGIRAFDAAFVADKGFSQRISSAPVSPVGQNMHVPTRYATALAAASTLAPDPTRTHRPENCEQQVAAIYGNVYVTDKYEGLIVVGIGTAIDGNPLNNFLHREATFNPDGVLNGASSIAIIGTYAYICCDAGLVVVALADPKHPCVTAVLGESECLKHPRVVQAQFRYAYVCDDEGIVVLNVTDLAKPMPVSKLPLHEANSIYLARTYAYVAAGSQGLVILDIERPEQPRIDQVYTADGALNDVRDVKLGITYTSEFAYVADGKNGLRVVQLTSPQTPGNQGYSPRPTPCLIATYPIHGGAALAISKGLDRDRAVDESGNQISVFGRVGARPFNSEEQRRLYLHEGRVWKVSDDPLDPMYGPPRRMPRP